MDVFKVFLNFERKYFRFTVSSDTCQLYPPKMYLNWYRLKPNLDVVSRDHAAFVLTIGLFGLEICCEVKWGHVERTEVGVAGNRVSLLEKGVKRGL